MVAEGVLEWLADVGTAGILEMEGVLLILSEDVKWDPGPVSSLGPGAVKGSSRYFEACE